MESQILNLQYSHLVRTAYLLADELIKTDLVQTIYSPQKTMSIEEWEKSFWLLLFQIDEVIYEECDLPLFSTGLHASLHLPESKYNTSTQVIPSNIVRTAQDLGRAFNQIISIVFNTKNNKLKINKQKDPFDRKNEDYLYQLSKQIVDLILIELCLKRSDIAEIY